MDDMQVYIANLGKYNEGELVGAWFTFPIDFEEVKEKIGLNKNRNHSPHEENRTVSVVRCFRPPAVRLLSESEFLHNQTAFQGERRD